MRNSPLDVCVAYNPDSVDWFEDLKFSLPDKLACTRTLFSAPQPAQTDRGTSWRLTLYLKARRKDFRNGSRDSRIREALSANCA